MASRTEISRRTHLSDKEMDEVIERASELQERERGADAGRSLDDVKEVGKELDIEPGYVDRAVVDLQRERDAAAAAQAGASRARQRLLTIALSTFLGLGAIFGVSAWAGASSVGRAEQLARQAEASLDTVLRRQATLVPQLVTLSGGNIADLAELQSRLENAPDLRSRLAAAESLRLALATKIAQLPPAQDPATAQQRLSLQHELVGSQNRVTVEQRRHEEALAAWRFAARSATGRLAVSCGFASGPN